VTSGTSGMGGLPILGNSCVTNGTYVYCVGCQNASSGIDVSKGFYAVVAADGTIGACIETTDHGATSGTPGAGGLGVEFSSSVTNSSYIYCVDGALSSSPWFTSKVYYAALSSSGVGARAQTTDYGAAARTNGSTGVPIYGTSCVM
jgi:hypothetical protein